VDARTSLRRCDTPHDRQREPVKEELGYRTNVDSLKHYLKRYPYLQCCLEVLLRSMFSDEGVIDIHSGPWANEVWIINDSSGQEATAIIRSKLPRKQRAL